MGEDVQDGLAAPPVLRELVDPRRCGRIELPATNDAALLERLQARCEDVRSAAVEAGVEVRVAERAVVQELAHDEQRPALAHEIEGVCDRAVLLVTLPHRTRVYPI